MREMWANLPTELSWSMWYGWAPSRALPDMALSVEGTGLISTYICYENAEDDERLALPASARIPHPRFVVSITLELRQSDRAMLKLPPAVWR